LDFARQSVPKKNSADINEIINKSISVIENQLAINNVKIEKNTNPNLPKITVDANQMQQVFINLFVNASDAMEKNGGTISLSTQQISLSPFGTAQIKKAACSKRHSLLDNEVKIDGLPSIKVKVRSNGDENIIHIDPVYGRLRDIYNQDYIEKKEAQYVCPECNISLVEENKSCPKCGSPILFFDTGEQGFYEVCSHKGCTWAKWDFVDSAGLKEFIEIKISDTGYGISRDDLTKIFEPFFSTKGQKGNGLGLAVIWGIIDNHNGTINVESEVGKGTTFTIRLPLSQ
jgi:signal transduction histidine kinase